MELKHILTLAVIVIATIFGTRHLTPEKVVYSTEHQQRQIDSLTVALQASFTTRQTLLDSLGNVSEGFRGELEDKNQTILALTRTTARLRLERDSLDHQLSLPAPPGINIDYFSDWAVIPDTTQTIRQVFGSGLFEVTVDYGIKNQTIYAHLHPPRMLRDIEFTTVTIQRDWTVTQIITSPDLTHVNMRTVTELEQPRRIPWFWIGTGVGAAAVLTIGAVL